MVKTTNVHGGNVHKASRLLDTSLDQILVPILTPWE